VGEHLLQLGAQAAVYNDDTGMRIAAVRQEIQAEHKPRRTGIFTTGIVCEGLQGEEGRSIRILRTGRHHAGENLSRVLDRRQKDRPPPLQMCDALERNEPREHPTELFHCIVHARRQFVDIRARFPEECRTVVESMGPVYRVDAECRKEKLGPEERLRRHQAQSGPVMETLRQELQEAVDRKQIEPNSALGGAVAYVLDRWSTLTLFLKVPGAPLDNNQTYAARGISLVMPTAGLCRVEWRNFGFSPENIDSGCRARGIIWPSGKDQGLVTNGAMPDGSPRFRAKSRARRLHWCFPARFRLPESLRIMPLPQRPDPPIQVENVSCRSKTRHNPAVGITGPSGC
jgi:hypothetical protein